MLVYDCLDALHAAKLILTLFLLNILLKVLLFWEMGNY